MDVKGKQQALLAMGALPMRLPACQVHNRHSCMRKISCHIAPMANQRSTLRGCNQQVAISTHQHRLLLEIDPPKVHQRADLS